MENEKFFTSKLEYINFANFLYLFSLIFMKNRLKTTHVTMLAPLRSGENCSNEFSETYA